MNNGKVSNPEKNTNSARRIVAEIDPDMLVADGYDDCIIGYCYTPGPGFRVVYDAKKMIKGMVEQTEMSYDEAQEHFEFNIEGGYLGEKTPIFMHRLEDY